MDPPDRRRLSRTLAVALRHRPERFGLVLDRDGWASVAAVVAALRERGGPTGAATAEDLRDVVALQEKPRYELSADRTRIRARYGHSVALEGLPDEVEPPTVLFHGTNAHAAEAILEEGLQAMGRRFVHLSAERETAVEVGRRRARRDRPLVVLRVDAAAAARDGHVFRLAADGVWLTDELPPRYLAREPGHGRGEDEEERS